MIRLFASVSALLLITLAVYCSRLLNETETVLVTQKQQATLKVGFAKRDITPKVGPGEPPVYMAGFGQNRVATGIQDPLFARAVVLDDGATRIALVSVDIVGFFYPNALNVRSALPGYSHVVVSSTHNHEGPDTLGLWGPSLIKNGINPAYLKMVEQESIQAVKEAEKSLTESQARFGICKAPELLVDKREPYLFHEDLYVLKFEDARGQINGLLVNWHCHPETLADKNTKISADYVGYCCDALQKKYNCPVAYFTGTVGGLMTTLGLQVRDEQGTLLPPDSLEMTIEYGKQLAKVAERAVDASVAVSLTPLKADRQEFYIPLANPLYKMGRTLGVLDRDAFRWNNDPLQAGEKLPARNSTGNICMVTETSLLTLGDVQIACIPGEIYPELVFGRVQDPIDPGADFPQAPAEPSIYGNMQAKYKMLFGLANDELGYFIPKRQWDSKPPFCYGRKKDQYGEENSCGPETAPIICDVFQRLTAGKK